MKRQIRTLNGTPRVWQANAFRAFKNLPEGKKDFLTVVTPGGGKTYFGLMISQHLFSSNLIDRLVVVVPSDHLRRQWAEDAAENGIDLDPEFKNSQLREAPDYHGVVVTYAQVGLDPLIHQALTLGKKTLVIFDEVHHAGDSKTWGDGVQTAFADAVFRLELSGTPFRSDDCMIPFVTYVNGVSKSDFEYSYGEAIQDGVCRTVYFPAYDGIMKYKVGDEVFTHSFNDSVDKDLVGKRLITALDVSGNWFKAVFTEANRKLYEIRMGDHRDAGGLIFAINQKHAKEIVKVIHSVTGQTPAVVTSDDTDGSGKIDRFKHSFDPWIVCVKMISEGVDIPRLRVGVYATNVKAELFFRQAVGRFVRVIKNVEAQDAFIYIPMDRDIVKLAETIEEEREHALEKCKAAAEEGETLPLFNDYKPARKGKFQALGSEVKESRLLRVNVGISSGARFTKVRTAEEGLYMQKIRLRDNINRLARSIAIYEQKRYNLPHADFKKYHSMWMKEKGGKAMEQETVEELQKREQFFRTIMANLNRNN